MEIAWKNSIIPHGKTLSDLVTERLDAATREAQRERARRHLPSKIDALDESAKAQAKYASLCADAAAALEVIEGIEAEVTRAAEATAAARADLEQLVQRLEAAKAEERKAFLEGRALDDAPDVGSLEGKVAAARRRVEALASVEAEKRAPLADARRAYAVVDDQKRSAAVFVARAKLIAAAVEPVAALVEAVAPLVRAMQRAVEDGGEETKYIGHRELRRAREQIARSLADILPDEAIRALGPIAR